MHEFTLESVEKYLTPEALKNINVVLPDNDGEYSSVEDFVNATDDATDLASNILSSIDDIIVNNKLPNIQGDECL